MISRMQMLNKEWIIEDMIRMVVLKQVSLKKAPESLPSPLEPR